MCRRLEKVGDKKDGVVVAMTACIETYTPSPYVFYRLEMEVLVSCAIMHYNGDIVG